MCAHDHQCCVLCVRGLAESPPRLAFPAGSERSGLEAGAACQLHTLGGGTLGGLAVVGVELLGRVGQGSWEIRRVGVKDGPRHARPHVTHDAGGRPEEPAGLRNRDRRSRRAVVAEQNRWPRPALGRSAHRAGAVRADTGAA